MPESLVINSLIVIPGEELQFSFARSSGPGGQNVNKVNTKARLRWDLTATTALPTAVLARLRERYRTRINEEGELLIASERYREQGRNIRDCVEKLRAMILSVLAPPRPRKRTKPSRGAVQRRLESKRQRSQTKRNRRPPPSE